MMESVSLPSFDQLSDNSKVWIFQSSKALSTEWVSLISKELTDFLEVWAAHGKDLFAAFEIRHGKFIIIAVDEQIAGATGCSIDGMMKEIQSIDLKFNLKLLDRMKVAYRLNGDILEANTIEFSTKVNNGELNKETIVFDNTVLSLGELNTKWETTVAKSWVVNLL